MGGYEFIAELPFEHVYIYESIPKIQVFIRDKFACQCCGRTATKFMQAKLGNNVVRGLFTDEMDILTIDHIKARAKGGVDHISNKMTLCSPCNWVKADRDLTLEELRQRIRCMFRMIY